MSDTNKKHTPEQRKLSKMKHATLRYADGQYLLTTLNRDIDPKIAYHVFDEKFECVIAAENIKDVPKIRFEYSNALKEALSDCHTIHINTSVEYEIINNEAIIRL